MGGHSKTRVEINSEVADNGHHTIQKLPLIIIIIIRAFVRRTMSASELNLRRRQSLGGKDG